MVKGYSACMNCKRNFDGGCPYDHDEDIEFDEDGICKFVIPLK